MTEDTRARIPGPIVIVTILVVVVGLGWLIYSMVTAGRR